MNVLFIVQHIIVRSFFETKSLQQQINGVIPNMKRTLFEYLKTRRVDLSSSQRFFLLWYDVDKNKKCTKYTIHYSWEWECICLGSMKRALSIHMNRLLSSGELLILLLLPTRDDLIIVLLIYWAFNTYIVILLNNNSQ